MNSDWARRSGMDKFLEMTSRKGRAGFGLGMSWQLIGERGSATHRSRQSLVAARERKGLSREPHVSTTAGVAAQRTAVMCSLVSTEMGVAGSLVDHSDWWDLVSLEICAYM